MGWLLAGALAQLVARWWGGAGTFEGTLSTLGFGIAIASWCTLAHDLVTSALGASRVMDQRAYEDAMSSPTPFRTLIWALMMAYAAAAARSSRIARIAPGTDDVRNMTPEERISLATALSRWAHDLARLPLPRYPRAEIPVERRRLHTP